MNVNLKSIVLSHNSFKGFNKDFPSLYLLLSKNISLALRRACLSWSFTLSSIVLFGPLPEMYAKTLSQFVYEKLLIWIEVMSLTGKFDALRPILQQAVSCLEVCSLIYNIQGV